MTVDGATLALANGAVGMAALSVFILIFLVGILAVRTVIDAIKDILNDK